jgi:heptosyltransferase III
MPSVLDQLAKGAPVCLLRLRSLGDCVLTTPAIGLLKRHRPDLRIGVAVDAPFRAIFESHPDITDLLEPTPAAVASYRAGLCVNLHGGTRSAWLTAASLARVRAGFGHYRFGALYNVRIPRAQQILGEERPVHTAEHLASAMFYLGVPPGEIPRAHLAATPRREDRPYAVLHP